MSRGVCSSFLRTTGCVLLLALLIGALWFGYALPAQAQGRTAGEEEDVRYTFALVGVSLNEALR